MKNVIRILTATLLLAACVSAAAPAKTNSQPVMQEGPSPVPLCEPGTKCQMPVSPSAAPAHR